MMMNANYSADRTFLCFTAEVKSHFIFLEPLGFRCVKEGVTLVQYESSKLIINVYHGRQSYEIGLEIEDIQTSTNYSFSEILHLVDSKQSEQYRKYSTRLREGVAEGVRQLADLFRKCVDAGTLSDSQLFSRLQLQREKWGNEYALETQLLQARKKSEDAWHKRDYATVVKSLKPLRAALTATEVGKLEFAEKKCNQTANQ
jgi:hypothetical protein